MARSELPSSSAGAAGAATVAVSCCCLAGRNPGMYVAFESDPFPMHGREIKLALCVCRNEQPAPTRMSVCPRVFECALIYFSSCQCEHAIKNNCPNWSGRPGGKFYCEIYRKKCI